MTNEEAANLNLETAKHNGNKLAFPIGVSNPFHLGLNKREYIAAQILSGLVSNDTDKSNIECVDISVDLTDRLLIALHSKK